MLPADVTSAPSLLTFRKRLKLLLFPLSYPGLVPKLTFSHCVVLMVAVCYLGHPKIYWLIDWLNDWLIERSLFVQSGAKDRRSHLIIMFTMQFHDIGYELRKEWCGKTVSWRERKKARKGKRTGGEKGKEWIHFNYFYRFCILLIDFICISELFSFMWTNRIEWINSRKEVSIDELK